ncbi:hypothetical protein Tb10.389.1460 [Trypanosoma brucei brucei TREU927]|uniref:T. brucei spp.-specific protein n=1 Tax=Trypanosoma brucei brucei (strain 927/4 GUTat10.1) TaxID=185431 RepID=Q389B5_TRYB2|nr:hypothetical protein Tb10.389.1460 [Trypanosoma brucei brucei TREU927]EAN78605.1 hypothetical protein Tb10.389.1460 [Trypanosoma brucei brucei TREU927]
MPCFLSVVRSRFMELRQEEPSSQQRSNFVPKSPNPSALMPLPGAGIQPICPQLPNANHAETERSAIQAGRHAFFATKFSSRPHTAVTARMSEGKSATLGYTFLLLWALLSPHLLIPPPKKQQCTCPTGPAQ